MSVQTIEDAATKVRELIKDICVSKYFTLEIDDNEYQIRVSDHSANGERNGGFYDGYFSFIREWNNQDLMFTSNMKNEWVVDEDGDFQEEFINIEECLDWNIN